MEAFALIDIEDDYIIYQDYAPNRQAFQVLIAEMCNHSIILEWRMRFAELQSQPKLMAEQFDTSTGLGRHQKKRNHKMLFDNYEYPQNFLHYLKYILFIERRYQINNQVETDFLKSLAN